MISNIDQRELKKSVPSTKPSKHPVKVSNKKTAVPSKHPSKHSIDLESKKTAVPS